MSIVELPPDPSDGSPAGDGISRGVLARYRVSCTIAALLLCASLIATALAWATPTLSLHASFSPDRPGAATNLSLTATLLSSTGALPSPITKFILYAPAGIGLDLHGAGVCAPAILEQRGPSACPADARAGFGGGVGLLQLPRETVHVPYTLDFFFAPKAGGRLRLLVYAKALVPATVEFLLVAKQIPAPRPYGLGFSVEVPKITTIPGAANASIESAFVTVGGPHVAYYEPVKGKRRLVHLRGLIVPQHCPSGGFPTEGKVNFADGSTLTVNSAIPCPQS